MDLFRMLQRKEEELVKRQTVERRALPKRIRAERKARDMMFRESLRISTNLDPDAEREKLKKVKEHFECFFSLCLKPRFNAVTVFIKLLNSLHWQFQEQEKKRYTQEQQRFDTKHMKQLEELRATAEGTVRYDQFILDIRIFPE